MALTHLQTLDLYPPAVRTVAESIYRCEVATTTPSEDQRSTGDDAHDVRYIIARSVGCRGQLVSVSDLTFKRSHAHWDHMFPVGQYFPNARLLCGPGTLEHTSQSYPRFANSPYDARIWDPTTSDLPLWDLPSPNDYPSKWQKLGPFEQAHDFLGDGSFWLINAPGHVEGNIAALCSTKTASGGRTWVLLAADCMHSCHFLDDPEAPFQAPISQATLDLANPQLRIIHAEPEKVHALTMQIVEFKRENPGSIVWLGHAAELEDRSEVDAGFR